jgi:AcrR family transcriptional regulator
MAKTLTRRQLYDLVWAMPVSTAAKKLGLSANGLAKICDRLMVPYPTRGHWSKTERVRTKPPLPRMAKLDAQPVVISGDRADSRRVRSRLSPEDRKRQLMEIAGRIVVEDGVHAISIKRIAREAGVSEALAFRYFKSLTDLLAELARNEIAEINAIRRAEIARGENSAARVAASTSAYLREVEARGALLPLLMLVPEVRGRLRQEHRSREEAEGRNVARFLVKRYGMAPDVAFGMTLALTAASRRAGRLLTLQKASRDMCERLVMAMITQSNRDLVGKARAERLVAPFKA